MHSCMRYVCVCWRCAFVLAPKAFTLYICYPYHPINEILLQSQLPMLIFTHSVFRNAAASWPVIISYINRCVRKTRSGTACQHDKQQIHNAYTHTHTETCKQCHSHILACRFPLKIPSRTVHTITSRSDNVVRFIFGSLIINDFIMLPSIWHAYVWISFNFIEYLCVCILFGRMKNISSIFHSITHIFIWAMSNKSAYAHTHTETKKGKKEELLTWCWRKKKKKIAASRLMLHINIDFLPIMFRRPKRSTFSLRTWIRREREKEKMTTNMIVNWKRLYRSMSKRMQTQEMERKKKKIDKTHDPFGHCRHRYCRCLCCRHQKAPI